MAKPFMPDSKNHLIVKLCDALGLSGYRITAIDIRAAAGEFPRATVEFLVPDQYVEAVAKAVEEHRQDLFDADGLPPAREDTIATLNRYQYAGHADWEPCGDLVRSRKDGATLSWTGAAVVAGACRARGAMATNGA